MVMVLLVRRMYWRNMCCLFLMFLMFSMFPAGKERSKVESPELEQTRRGIQSMEADSKHK